MPNYIFTLGDDFAPGEAEQEAAVAGITVFTGEREHGNAIEVFCYASDCFSDSRAIEQAAALRNHILHELVVAQKLRAAINACFDTANGRQSEWGSRAEAAFAHLYNAMEAD